MCNCGKSTPPPPPPPTGPTQKASVTTGTTQSFTYTPPAGRAQKYGSRLEAEAARVRAGGVGSIAPL